MKYEVHTGRPSWHQNKAGHISAGITVFGEKDEAEAYLARCKELRPHEPAFILPVEES